MKIFIDSANLVDIEKADELGVVVGVTTNPSLIAKEAIGMTVEEVVKKICDIVDGPISGEVNSLDSKAMIVEGERIASIHKNIVVKIPMSVEGLKAIKILSTKGIKTNVTLIFTPAQALLAANAGATYVSPFVGRLDDVNADGIHLIEEIASIFIMHDIKTEIIAASIRNVNHVTQAALAGAHIATIPYKVIEQMINHPLTTKGIEQFASDYNKGKK